MTSGSPRVLFLPPLVIFVGGVILVIISSVSVQDSKLQSWIGYILTVIGGLSAFFAELAKLYPFFASAWQRWGQRARAWAAVRPHLGGPLKELPAKVEAVERSMKHLAATGSLIDHLDRQHPGAVHEEAAFLVRCSKSAGEARGVIQHCVQSPIIGPTYHEGLLLIAEAWGKIFASVRDDAGRRLVTAFFKRYALEENEHLRVDGEKEKGKSVVITSFLAYSGLVEAVIQSAVDSPARAGHPEEGVICFTTLPIPLRRWFNWVRDEHGRCYQVHPRWEEYTRSLTNLLQTRGGLITLERCLVVSHQDATEFVKSLGLPFHTLDYMKKEANKAILIPERGNLEPFGSTPLAGLLAKDNPHIEPLRDLYGRVAERGGRAYLIHPKESARKLNESFPIEGYRWAPLGQEFMHRFHSFPADQNLGYVELAPDAIRSSFATDTPSQKMPTDLFIIGEKIDGRTNWLFCLAGDVDADNTRVSLEFLTKDINGERFRRILNYVELELRKGRKTVADWWDA